METNSRAFMVQAMLISIMLAMAIVGNQYWWIIAALLAIYTIIFVIVD